MFSCLSSDQGVEGDFTQQKPEAAAGGGAGLWKLHEQGSEGERLRLQGVFAQQDRWYQIQYRQVRTFFSCNTKTFRQSQKERHEIYKSHIWNRECVNIDETPDGFSCLNLHNKSNILHIWHVHCFEGRSSSVCLCLQKHHSPALPDHHPGEEIPQSPDVPGGPAEYLRGSQSQVGGAVENLLSDTPVSSKYILYILCQTITFLFLQHDRDGERYRQPAQRLEKCGERESQRSMRWYMLCVAHAVTQCSAQGYSSFFLQFSGAGIPEEAAAGAGRQVRVGGEPVHHRGQLQLLRCGGLSRRGQGTGKSLRPYRLPRPGQHRHRL